MLSGRSYEIGRSLSLRISAEVCATSTADQLGLATDANRILVHRDDYECHASVLRILLHNSCRSRPRFWYTRSRDSKSRQSIQFQLLVPSLRLSTDSFSALAKGSI